MSPHRREPECQRGELSAQADEHWVGADQERACPCLDQGWKDSTSPKRPRAR